MRVVRVQIEGAIPVHSVREPLAAPGASRVADKGPFRHDSRRHTEAAGGATPESLPGAPRTSAGVAGPTARTTAHCVTRVTSSGQDWADAPHVIKKP
jgi:hypothetical protein